MGKAIVAFLVLLLVFYLCRGGEPSERQREATAYASEAARIDRENRLVACGAGVPEACE